MWNRVFSQVQHQKTIKVKSKKVKKFKISRLPSEKNCFFRTIILNLFCKIFELTGRRSLRLLATTKAAAGIPAVSVAGRTIIRAHTIWCIAVLMGSHKVLLPLVMFCVGYKGKGKLTSCLLICCFWLGILIMMSMGDTRT